MGVGVFNIMFWLGFIAGHDLGLTCSGMLLNALLFGAVGSYGIVKLERIDLGKFRSRKAEPASTTKNFGYPVKATQRIVTQS